MRMSSVKEEHPEGLHCNHSWSQSKPGNGMWLVVGVEDGVFPMHNPEAFGKDESLNGTWQPHVQRTS